MNTSTFLSLKIPPLNNLVIFTVVSIDLNLAGIPFYHSALQDVRKWLAC